MGNNAKGFWSRRLVWLGLLALLSVAAGGVVGYLLQPRGPVETVEQPALPQERPMREVLLYFASPEGIELVGEERQLPACEVERDCVAGVVEALVQGPRQELVPVLPQRTALRGLELEGDKAVLDFSRELISAHPGGSSAELLTVYALADTLAANFPHLRRIRILVEGEGVETIKGHVDIREPVQADFRYTRSEEPAGDQETTGQEN